MTFKMFVFEDRVPLRVAVQVLLLFSVIRLGSSYCLFTYEAQEVNCQNTTYKDLVGDIFRSTAVYAQNRIMFLSIEQSIIKKIDYLPKLPFVIERLRISSSSLKAVEPSAFEEHSRLRELYLNDNNLRNLSFLQGLQYLYVLDLSRNNISYIEINDFQNLRLNYLDLSYNYINFLDLNAISSFSRVNLFNNDIVTLFPTTSRCYCDWINLGSNLITAFNESELNCEVNNLDLSINNLGSLHVVYGEKNFVNLSGNQIVSISSNNKRSLFRDLDLSNQRTDINQKWYFQVRNKLNLSGNKLAYLSNDNLDIKTIMEDDKKVDFSNCSIEDIQKGYFDYIRLQILNMSYNNISAIRNQLSDHCDIFQFNLSFSNIYSIEDDAFSFSKIKILDLSHNRIELIKNSFREANIEVIDLSYNTIKSLSNISFRAALSVLTLNLSHNEIDDLNNTFAGENIEQINLSHNRIKFLTRNSFGKSNSIKILNISYCQIEKIEEGALIDLNQLETIDLRFNRIISLKRNTFSDLRVTSLILSGNQITTIQSHAFSNLHCLVDLDLSNLQIKQIEKEAFVNMNRIESIDLEFNRIDILETNTFSNLSVRYVLLRGNNISSIKTMAFSNLPELSYLYLSNTGIENLEEYAFYNLAKMEKIDLTNNYIKIIPNNLFYQTPSLSKVLLSGNNITNLHPFFDRISLNTLSLTVGGSLEPGSLSNVNLEHLVVNNSVIEILKRNTFKGLFNVIDLKFTGSNIYSIEKNALNDLFKLTDLDEQTLFKYTKTIEENTFKDMRSLKTLNLSSLSLENLKSNCFWGLEQLESLRIDNNNIKELKDYTFNGLNYLRSLNLSHNHIISISGGNLTFKGLKSLLSLDLSHNNINSISENNMIFSDLKSLISLDLSFNNIKQILDGTLTGLENLYEIRLNNNQLIHFNANLPQLRYLHLENNKFTELHRVMFSSLHWLQELHLDNNHLDSLHVGVFHDLFQLKQLNLSYNSISHLKDGLFTNLASLVILDLSNNFLNHFEDIGVFYPLKSLKKLYLNNNFFTNMIPFQILYTNEVRLNYVGISGNPWTCGVLSLIITELNKLSIDYYPPLYDFNNVNINGIICSSSSTAIRF